MGSRVSLFRPSYYLFRGGCSGGGTLGFHEELAGAARAQAPPPASAPPNRRHSSAPRIGLRGGCRSNWEPTRILKKLKHLPVYGWCLAPCRARLQLCGGSGRCLRPIMGAELDFAGNPMWSTARACPVSAAAARLRPQSCGPFSPILAAEYVNVTWALLRLYSFSHVFEMAVTRQDCRSRQPHRLSWRPVATTTACANRRPKSRLLQCIL